MNGLRLCRQLNGLHETCFGPAASRARARVADEAAVSLPWARSYLSALEQLSWPASASKQESADQLACGARHPVVEAASMSRAATATAAGA